MSVRYLWETRRCWICHRYSNCGHREPEVDIAALRSEMRAELRAGHDSGHFDGESMNRFDLSRLATYNAEVARGIVHTDDWKLAMAALQAEWDAAIQADPNFGLTERITAFMAEHDPKPWWWPGK